MATITYTGSLTVTSCWCGIRVAIPDDLYDLAQRKGSAVYCPLGHTFVYGDAENKRLKRERAELEAQLSAARATQDRLREEARRERDRTEHERRRVTGYQGALAKQKKRAARGVCPAAGCQRSFVDVARHVATCHPDFVDIETTP